MYFLPVADRVFESEFEIKRSRFLGFISRASDEEEARAFIHEIKARFPDARHHCSAFIYHVDGANPVERSNDDGEPSGTAGLPMLEVLRGSGLQDIAAVSVRYFGGIKLGTGGLVRAYSDSVSLTLKEVQSVQKSKLELAQVAIDYQTAGQVESELRNRGIVIVGTDYGELATHTAAIEPGTLDELNSVLAAVTHGTAEAKVTGEKWVETPRPS